MSKQFETGYCDELMCKLLWDCDELMSKQFETGYCDELSSLKLFECKV